MSKTDLDPSLDGQLQMKKRARRRLVGAAALALLAAIVLPMIMDHEPRQPVQDVQVKIPSPDAGGFTSRIIPAKPAPDVATKAAAPAEVKSADTKDAESKPQEAKPPEVKPAKAPVAEEPASERAPPKAAEIPKEKAADKVVDKTPEKAAAKPAEKPAPKPAEKPEKPEKPAEKPIAKDDSARAAALLSGGGNSQWVVQLGAYKEAGNVKNLVAKIKQMNLPTYTEDFDSPQGPRTRVRAGPFPSKEAAEKAQARIRRIGVDGPVAPR